ncbi:hypothetical protein [Streptomyces sp. CB03911]|uniref:DUF6907 domain-containing protein n=1 Tax=Streptomyces sp. CB03911 TaxID=1804758 RepID=UPI00094022A5|nr:hypothetical protein [Streptomyces sp. CB03911]OKI14168.1 hypothetical protein A6A07_13515 [Streptomyces sp. CB03911]
MQRTTIPTVNASGNRLPHCVATAPVRQRFTATPEPAPTQLIAADRTGLEPIDIRRNADGSATGYYDPTRFSREQANHVLVLLGFPAAPGVEDLYAAELRRVEALAAAEVAASPDARTIDLAVWGNATLTVVEPAWCTREHVTDGRGEHPEDVHHTSTETAAEVTRVDGEKETLLSGWIVQNPYLERMPEVRAAIALATGDVEEYDAAGLARLADEIRSAAAFIDGLREQLLAAEDGAQ